MADSGNDMNCTVLDLASHQAINGLHGFRASNARNSLTVFDYILAEPSQCLVDLSEVGYCPDLGATMLQEIIDVVASDSGAMDVVLVTTSNCRRMGFHCHHRHDCEDVFHDGAPPS